MTTHTARDATNTFVIAINLSCLRNFLNEAAARSSEAFELIQRDEHNRAFGVLSGLEALLEDSKAALLIATFYHSQATNDTRIANPPHVVGLLTPEDLAYVLNLLEAEESLQEESQHLPGEMPQGICSRIVLPTLDSPSVDGLQGTSAQLERLSQYWSQIAGEAIQAECSDYAFITRCSELAALRLERQYNDRSKALAVDSHNLGSWFFLLER